MTITQKRIFEVTLPNRLNNLLEIKDHSVSTLRDLRTELLNFGNEITETLGIFEPKTAAPQITEKNHVGKTLGTPEQKNKIFQALKTNSRMNSKDVGILLGISSTVASTLLSSLVTAKLLNRIQDPSTKFRQFLYELPPNGIDILEGLSSIE